MIVSRRRLSVLATVTAAFMLGVIAALPAGTAPAADVQTKPTDVACPAVQLAPRLASDRRPDGSRVQMRPDTRGRYVPVVMVHGWTGRATHDERRTGAFSHLINLTTNRVAPVSVPRSLVGQLQNIPGAAVFTFDYHDYSARWVNDPHTGPALGDAISCLHRQTGEKVIVIAHSMGGLLARYALTQGKQAQNVSTLVTFGTPQAGSVLADLVAGGLDAGAAVGAIVPAARQLAVLRLILSACGEAATESIETGSPCDFLPAFARAFDSAAGRALQRGSRELAALAPVPGEVTLDALAGETTFKVPRAGWFAAPWDTDDVAIGDLIVTRSSATKGASLEKRASCDYQLNAVRGASDSIGLVFKQVTKSDVAEQPLGALSGPCFHTSLMRTIELTNQATGAVNDDIEARRPLSASDLLSAPVPRLCGHHAGRLVDGELLGIARNRGFVALASKRPTSEGHTNMVFADFNADGVRDAATVVGCNQGGVPWGQSVMLYGPGPTRLGGITLTKISKEQGRDYVYDLAVRDGRVLVTWTADRNSDFGCCPTLDWSAVLGLDGKRLTITDVHSYEETPTAQRILGAVRRRDRAAAAELATPDVVDALFAAGPQVTAAKVECHGAAPIMDETWPAAALEYWEEWPPPADEDNPVDYGGRYCLMATTDNAVPAILGMEHLGYRKWRAVSYTSPVDAP